MTLGADTEGYDSGVMAMLPLDVYGHSDVKILKHFDDSYAVTTKQDLVKTYSFKLLGVKIKAKVLYVAPCESGIGYVVFQPIHLPYIKKYSRAWNLVSKKQIGALKNELIQEGWVVNLPI